jgi:hypothetical protein
MAAMSMIDIVGMEREVAITTLRLTPDEIGILDALQCAQFKSRPPMATRTCDEGNYAVGHPS